MRIAVCFRVYTLCLLCPSITNCKGRPIYGEPLKNCNSLRNWAVAFFMTGRGNEKATVLFPIACVGVHNLK